MGWVADSTARGFGRGTRLPPAHGSGYRAADSRM